MGNTAATKGRSQIAASKNELVKLISLNSAVCNVSFISYTKKVLIHTPIRLTQKLTPIKSTHEKSA